MLLLLLFFAICRSSSEVAINSTTVGFTPSIHRDSGQPSRVTGSCKHSRTVWSILWSCLLTVFACTWTAVHPNIPGPDETKLSILRTRMTLVAVALIAPEYILFWALEQRRAAAGLVLEAKKSVGNNLGEWTLSHGFMVVMGGFVLEDAPGAPVHAVVPGHCGLQFKHFNFPRITPRQIQDRSKTDALSKLIVIAQLFWFLTQCIARGVRGLAVTELELVTAAYAVMSVLIYIAWWDKPKAVATYIPVTLARNGKYEPRFRFDQKTLNHNGWTLSRLLQRIHLNREPRIPTLFSGGETSVKWDNRASLAKEYATGVLFGAIHCIGWKFQFLSLTEKFLWRTSSASISIYAVLGLTLFLWLEAVGGDENKMPSIVLLWLAVLTFRYGPPIYVIFRLVLIILPFLALRHIPESA